MKKVLETLRRNFIYYFLHFLLIPIIVSLIFYFLYLAIIWKKSNEKISLFNFIKANIFLKKNICVMLTVLYLTILYHSTVTNRIFTGQRLEPLSEIFVGWKIVELQYFYDFSPIWNIIMFIPMAIIISMHLKYVKGYEPSNIKIIYSSALLCFAFSAIIEVSQIIFSCGTFQFADLFYNTVGGLLGALVYILTFKIHKKLSTKR